MAQNVVGLNKTWAVSLLLALVVVCFMNYQQANSTPVSKSGHKNSNTNTDTSSPAPEPIELDDEAPWDDGLTMVPSAPDCNADEQSQPGLHPSCEPTCDNPNPVCIKIYFLDYVPCFCKKGLLRDTQSKRCVPASRCPSKARANW